MTSKISCFDRAVFRRALKKTAPVWILYTLYELLLPLRLFSFCRPEFGMTAEEIRAELEPSRYIGRCPEQVAAMTAACRTLIGADAQQAEELTL